MGASPTTKLSRDANSGSFGFGFLDESGTGAGPFDPKHASVDSSGALVDPASRQDVNLVVASLGTDGANPVFLAGSTGVRGWLRSIAATLAGILTFQQYIGGQALSSTNRVPVELDLDAVGLAKDTTVGQVVTAAGTLHTDLGVVHNDLATLHTDVGTTVHGDLGTLHADLTTGNASLASILTTLQAQRAETLWTDDTGAFFVRVDNRGTISWVDILGNVSTGPGTSARPAAGATTLLSRSSYQALVGGPGFAAGDYLDHFVTTDPLSGAVVGSFWVDTSTGAKIASPAAASITPLSPLPIGAAQDGVDANGVAQLAGGQGIRGWLSGIYLQTTLGVADLDNLKGKIPSQVNGRLPVDDLVFSPIRGSTVSLQVGPAVTTSPVALAANVATSYRVRNSGSSSSPVTFALVPNNGNGAAYTPTIPTPYDVTGKGGTAGDKTIEPGGVEIIGLSAAQQAALAAGTLFLSALTPQDGSATLSITPGTGA